MNKIIFIHYAYPPNIGGVEILLREHALLMKQKGYEVSVLAGFGREQTKGINVIEDKLFQAVLRFNPTLQEKIMRDQDISEEFIELSSKIEKKLETYLDSQDVIIIHNMLTLIHNTPFIFAFKNYAKKHPRKKFIAWVHDHKYIGFDRTRENEFQLPPYISELICDKIPGVTYVSISHTLKKLLLTVTNLTDKEVHIIPNGINIAHFLKLESTIYDFYKSLDYTHRFPVIMSPVNISERKNLLYGIKVVSHLKQYFPKIVYVITGKISRHKDELKHFEELKKEITKLSLSEHVMFSSKFFAKPFTKSEISDLYKISDLILLPSKGENFGLPLLESFFSKVPIFTSNLEVFHEIGEEYVQFIDYKKVSPEKAAEKIKTSIEKDKRLQAFYYARANFSLDTILTEKLIPLLK